ncbi:Imidazoleglycerol-phosphate dehydratase [Poriferisphaera corsica]|uniref:Imidazoleglycerol-phosphate dehydratase n=1 Tax=Poriferisphaera corsica TaxID=2528020 RepID=A0A517YTV7_9BACT|nr:imidazoleglycerol-phosphate dehydratase HisB [Poriferisphaera corsica]QDU33670.1 Imidazoleglycerol-phosphate dehydratase [Poriferisphaera corsica]
MSNRTALIERKTNETEIKLDLDLDDSGYEMNTGVGFFDHMLDHIARHGQIALSITAKGDLHVDDHHTVEDVGIVLGQAIDKALGDKRGIERYGSSDVCMDESLARVALDLSGRPAFVFHVDFKGHGKIGTFDVQLVKEFFNAVVNNAKMNLHIEVPWGENNHHISEAVFKAFGRALRQAIAVTGDQIPSTKGSL